VKLTIPRPTAEVPEPVGLGRVIIEYADAGAAVKARTAMQGRKFGGHVVQANFLTEEQYAAGQFS
jgi:splicing factor U2AF subunit